MWRRLAVRLTFSPESPFKDFLLLPELFLHKVYYALHYYELAIQ